MSDTPKKTSAAKASATTTKPAGANKKASGKAKAAAANKAKPTKLQTLIDLLRRPGGVTLDEMVKATGWQAHSVRGALSGTLKKKHGLTIDSEKIEDRGRVYRIVEAG